MTFEHLRGLADATDYRFTPREVAVRVGIPPDDVRRISRALGFPEAADDEPAFSDDDVAAFAGVAQILTSGLADMTLVLQIARVVGQGTSRMAVAQASALQERIQGRLLDHDFDEEAVSSALDTMDTLLPFLEHALVQTWRRHIVAATSANARGSGAAGPRGHGHDRVIAVGFADLVGFTALSRALTTDELVHVIDRFENVCFDAIAGAGATVVKLIGDEVMFVAERTEVALRAAMTLVEACGDEPALPPARAGLSFGPVIGLGGDYFGPTVNLAGRLVAAAAPGTVLVSEEGRRSLPDEVPWWRLRGRMLKGVGLRPVWEFPATRTPTVFSAVRTALARAKEAAVSLHPLPSASLPVGARPPDPPVPSPTGTSCT